MSTIEMKAQRLKKLLEQARQDESYCSLSSRADGTLARSGRDFLRRHARNIERLEHECELYERMLRILRGEVFTLHDIDRCRREIMHRYPCYEQPITAASGILLATEAIRKSFGKRFYLLLYRNPIRIDLGFPDNRIRIVHPSNFVEYHVKEERKE